MHTTIKLFYIFFLVFIIFLTSCMGIFSKADKLTLIDNGKTNYVIMVKDNPTDMEKFAVKELQGFLKKSTGAEISTITEINKKPADKYIVIGDTSKTRSILGDKTITALGDQEALVAVKNGNIYLTGRTEWGTLYAVYSFLENEVGCRWYTALGDIFVPKLKKLCVDTSLKRKEKPAFKYRYQQYFVYSKTTERNLFFFRNRLNEGLGFGTKVNPGMKAYLPMLSPGVHTSFYYINPHAEIPLAFKHYKYQPPKRNLFKTNPEFFSMNSAGKRIKTSQLCFSNPGLRKMLTDHLEKQLEKSNGRGVITLDANDVPGKFCHCPDCRKLEEKYACISGPVIDYLIEFCSFLKKNYPHAYVKTLAYRKKQSEIPPRVKKLPDNLIIIFAPIDDNFAQTLDHPSNLNTYENLKKWCEIAKNVWVWYYTNPYSGNPPIGNIKRMTKDIRLMKKAGANGTFFEHDSGVAEGYNFADLQTWLLVKLYQNPNQDTAPLIKEFTDYYYGPAAQLMRQYLNELENLREQMTSRLSWNPTLSMYTYLTPERIVAWQKMFDRMEELVKDNPDQLSHVGAVRLTLDVLTIDKWKLIKKQFPDFKPTPETLEERIISSFDREAKYRFDKQSVLNARRKRLTSSLGEKILLATRTPKPLPAPLDKIPPEKIRQAFPTRKTVKDTEAALGFAQTVTTDENPFTLGFYDEYNKKFVINSKISAEEIKPGKYHLYKIGRTTLSRRCYVWLSKSWRTNVSLDQFYTAGDPFKEWDIYASIKFQGPAFDKNSKAKESSISFDRAVMVSVD